MATTLAGPNGGFNTFGLTDEYSRIRRGRTFEHGNVIGGAFACGECSTFTLSNKNAARDASFLSTAIGGRKKYSDGVFGFASIKGGCR